MVECPGNNDTLSDPRSGECRPPQRSIIDVPPELLIVIFQLYLPKVDFISIGLQGTCRSYLKGLSALRLVARSWRDLLDLTASFWVVISSTVPWHVNHKSITRSGDALIMIHFGRFSSTDLSEEGGYRSLARFLQLLALTRHRWRMIWVDDYSPKAASAHLAVPASLIETVHLHGYGGPVHLLGGKTHNIRHLDLYGVEIHWEQCTLRGLKTLRLWGSVGERITTDLILGLLANSPDLEDLRIKEVGIQLSATPSIPRVVLPHLHSLELRSLRTEILDLFLRHIEAPHCQEIRLLVEYELRSDTSIIFGESLKSFEPALQRLHKKSGGSKFCVQGRTMYWLSRSSAGGRERRPSFEIMTLSNSFISSLRWVGRVLDNIDPEGLTVEINIDGSNALGDPEVVSILRHLRSVTEIHASSDAENSQRTLQILCDPSQNFPLPPFPSLRVLRVGYVDVSIEEILDMARARFTHPTQSLVNVPDLKIIVDMEDIIAPVPRRDLDFGIITQVRSIEGVTLKFRLNDAYEMGDGMLAAVWDE